MEDRSEKWGRKQGNDLKAEYFILISTFVYCIYVELLTASQPERVASGKNKNLKPFNWKEIKKYIQIE